MMRGEPCENEFTRLASVDPHGLAAWIAEGSLEPTMLTFAAEHMGRASDRALVLRSLLPLLDHAKPYVREGALIGLGPHLGADLCTRCERLAAEDQCNVLRSMAAGYLEDLRAG